MELFAALLGAVVGGAISGVVAWLQTKSSLRHEFELARQALEEDRKEGRAALSRTAALDALQAIAALDAAMPYLHYRFAFIGGNVPGYVLQRRSLAESAIREIERAGIASVPVLGHEMQHRWADLLLAAKQTSHEDWSESKTVDHSTVYTEAAFVHHSLQAVIDSEPVPSREEFVRTLDEASSQSSD